MTYTIEQKRAYQREHYRRNKETYMQKAAVNKKKQRAELRAIISKAKDKPCADCGTKYPSYVMQFDHIGKKNFSIANAVNGIAKERLLHEISLCEVVCANCHAIRTHKRHLTKAAHDLLDSGSDTFM